MARRLVVSDGTLAREVQTGELKVAVGGLVKDVKIACVAQGGVVRQFWPKGAGLADERIVFNNTPLTVVESVADPLDSAATINFSRALGTYTYDNYPSSELTEQYLSPVLDGTAGDDDKYLIRVDQLSGTALTGTLATWIDINSAANHIWSLDQTVVGVLGATANISISQDNGSGVPVSVTTITKLVTFSSEVRVANNIAWSETQHDLVEQKEGEDADCILTFNPTGTAVGDADTSGSFSENWHTDTPAVESPGSFTVNATLVSGTAPTGSALGSNLTLDVVREWTLLATSGENFSCDLDVTVSDGVNPVTKRITMNSERTVAATSVVMTTTQINASDVTSSPPAGITILVDDDGVLKITQYNGPTTWGEDWHNEAPTPSDLANYEVKVDVITGDADDVTDPKGSWVSLATAQSWAIEALSGELNITNITLSIRRIGEAAVVKPIKATLLVEVP